MAIPARSFQSVQSGRITAFALILFGFLFGCGDGIPDFTPEELAEATAKVEEAYHQMDFEFGAELGEQWAAWAPDALELRAWTVANFCGAELEGMAEGMAEEMMASHPDSPWSSLALGMVRVAGQDEDKSDEALEASEKALAGLPDLTDAMILRGKALFLFQDPDSAMAFVGTLSEPQLAHPDVRVALAEAQLEAGLRTAFVADDVDQALEALLEGARLAYENILQEHPSHIAANLGARGSPTTTRQLANTSKEPLTRATARPPTSDFGNSSRRTPPLLRNKRRSGSLLTSTPSWQRAANRRPGGRPWPSAWGRRG